MQLYASPAANALRNLFASVYLAWTRHGEDRAMVATATTSTRTPKWVEDVMLPKKTGT